MNQRSPYERKPRPVARTGALDPRRCSPGNPLCKLGRYRARRVLCCTGGWAGPDQGERRSRRRMTRVSLALSAGASVIARVAVHEREKEREGAKKERLASLKRKRGSRGRVSSRPSRTFSLGGSCTVYEQMRVKAVAPVVLVTRSSGGPDSLPGCRLRG